MKTIIAQLDQLQNIDCTYMALTFIFLLCMFSILLVIAFNILAPKTTNKLLKLINKIY